MTPKKMTKMAKIKNKIFNKCLITLKKILPKDESYNAQPLTHLGNIAKTLNFKKDTAKLSYYILKKIKSKDLLNG